MEIGQFRDIFGPSEEKSFCYHKANMMFSKALH